MVTCACVCLRVVHDRNSHPPLDPGGPVCGMSPFSSLLHVRMPFNLFFHPSAGHYQKAHCVAALCFLSTCVCMFSISSVNCQFPGSRGCFPGGRMKQVAPDSSLTASELTEETGHGENARDRRAHTTFTAKQQTSLFT